MPHFTVVPVDGPRRGDYDNLEGLSWVDYGERAEREDSDDELYSCHFLTK
uniref:Solute carrier family 12 member 4 n=1 Tax=Ursus americanus TaxID=9643 RepID=A0A452RMS4_URSAM